METRRAFLEKTLAGWAGCLLAGAGAPSARGGPVSEGEGDGPPPPMEARYYEKLEDVKIRCKLCPRECSVADRERGYCGVRENRKGVYYTLVHSRPCTVHVDPIEKKPLFHFLPGSRAFSLATVGCNMECRFCQNWEISQFRPEQRPYIPLAPAAVAREALRAQCRSIAYTYTEPVIFYEYMYDCAVAGRKAGVRSAMISNGYIQEKPMRALIPHLDAVKIDLKAFTDTFYRDLCSGRLDPVLQVLKLLEKTGIWFEIVVLLIPTKNDSPEEIERLCSWVVENLSDTVPLHFSRYFPTYKLKDIPPTPESTLNEAYAIARKVGLKFPYIGNIPGSRGENTLCPHCGRVVVERHGYYVAKVDIEDGDCVHCRKPVPGIWK